MGIRSVREKTISTSHHLSQAKCESSKDEVDEHPRKPGLAPALAAGGKLIVAVVVLPASGLEGGDPMEA